jgi:hypothetical protein
MARSGFIYRIWSVIDDEDYVGSTWNSLGDRLACHKAHIQGLMQRDKPVAKSLQHFSNIGWNNVEIEIVEEREFDNVDDRLFCERDWIERLKPSLNTMRRPRITEEERKEWNKEYYQRPEVKERQQEYMKTYNTEYREKHKEELNERARQYSKTRKGVKWTCPHCDIEIGITSKSRHIKRRHPENLHLK